MYSINLKKNKDLYFFSSNDIPNNLDIDSLPKGTDSVEEQTNSHIINNGVLIIPSSLMNQKETEKLLESENSRGQVLKNIISQSPSAGLLGLLSLNKELIEQVDSLAIAESASLDIAEEYFEESITLEFDREIDLNQEELNIDLTLFSGDSTKSKSINEVVSASSTDLDIITKVVYYDSNNQEMHEEYLFPRTRKDISNNGVIVNVNNSIETSSGNKKRTGFFRIKIFITKVAGKVRKILQAMKDETVDLVVEVLRKWMRKKIRKRYKILKYSLVNKKFYSSTVEEIDPDKKSLILLHGTLKGSFDGLFKNKRKQNGSFMYLMNYKFKRSEYNYDHWFDYLTNHKVESIRYEQILTFEHETILDSPEDNIQNFIKLLNLDKLHFTQPVSIVAASRGSLLAKELCINPLTAHWKIERLAIVSGGSSDYFQGIEACGKYVNLMEKLFSINIPMKFLLSLSLDIILNLPGLEAQNKESKRFKRLFSAGEREVYVFNMTNDFIPLRNDTKRKSLAKLANLILKKKNDLLLTIDAQENYKPGKKYSSFEQKTYHGQALASIAGKTTLFNFLTGSLNSPA